MEEYISRENAIKAMDKVIYGASTVQEANAMFKIKSVIYNQDVIKFPPDVQIVKHGRWIEASPKHSRCSVCDTTCLIAVYPISKGANYCPNCGARMDGGAENETE